MALKKKRVNLNKEVYVVTENGFIRDILCDYCAEENPYFQKMVKEFNLTVTKRKLTEEEKEYIRKPWIGCSVNVCGY